MILLRRSILLQWLILRRLRALYVVSTKLELFLSGEYFAELIDYMDQAQVAKVVAYSGEAAITLRTFISSAAFGADSFSIVAFLAVNFTFGMLGGNKGRYTLVDEAADGVAPRQAALSIVVNCRRADAELSPILTADWL